MMSELTPEEAGTRDLPMAFRGYSPKAVTELVGRLNDRVLALQAERNRLAGRFGEFASRDLEGEFRQLGDEVSEVLEAARRAAESMRERASGDAARWRSEGLAEVEAERRGARADAEQLRGDAWSTAEGLLAQCQAEVGRLRADAEKDALRKVGEAEREAHRITSVARRESDDQIRAARMEAERLVVAAQSQHDEIIETARRQAESAQERARALEQRRDELKREIDSVREALSGMEGEVDGRREKLGLSQQTPDEAPTTPPPRWSPGETVRVLRKSGEPRDESEPKVIPAPPKKVEPPDPKRSPGEFADALVSALKGPRTVPAEPQQSEPPELAEPPEVPEPVGVEQVEPGPEAVVEEPVEEITTRPLEGVSVLKELSGLFDRLRSPAPPPVVFETPSPMEPEREPEPAVARGVGYEPFELRDRLLLPVTNRALKGIKRQLTEDQNLALQQLRIDDKAWKPDAKAMRQGMHTDLVALSEESFAAGHAAAEEASGSRIEMPAPPRSEPGSRFIDELVSEISHVLKDGRGSGHGARQLGSDVSRIFRAWRTDEAERRVRDVAGASYHAGLAASLRSAGVGSFAWIVSGRGCASCRAAVDHPDVEPPLHPGCSCTVVPA